MSNEELKELFKFILHSESCEDITGKISGIRDTYVLHTLAYNMNYHKIYYYKSGNFCIENAVINNPDCDLGTAMLLFYFWDGFSYLLDSNIRYNKVVSLINRATASKETQFLKKVYEKILNRGFKTGIAYKPKIGKIELSIFEKRNFVPPKVFLEETPGIEYEALKIWYK